MGIKHFFHWFKNRFADNIYKLKKGELIQDIQENIFQEEKVHIDNFMIDMNGIFHNVAQKVYEYGNGKPRQSLLQRRVAQNVNGLEKQVNCFTQVCETIDKVVNIVQPKKRLVLCVDGPAPLSKQNQQRQRRFMSALNATVASQNSYSRKPSFDSNSITPGTKFMDYLTKYIDWYIRKRMSEDTNSVWNKIEVVFSNEKAPGEGEHKILNYIRQYGDRNESYCIHGMDADLIMLSLGTHLPKFYLLREEPMDTSFEYYVIDIGGVRLSLADLMTWKNESNESNFDIECAINDFIFMCFTVGNDFLPHIPGIEIIEGGIDFMLDVYKNVCSHYGHITKNTEGGVKFCKKSLKAFMGTISQYEKGVLEDKLTHKSVFFQDLLLEKNSTVVEGKYSLDIENYKKDYYDTNLQVQSESQLCHAYLEGMQWVLSYYTKGVPNWKWRFPYHYAPFASTIASHVSTFKFPTYLNSIPTVPFLQLLCVLPPESSHLLPSPLKEMLTSENSPISQYCPKHFDIDLAGKRKEWEGVVLLPIVDYPTVEKEYFNRIQYVDEKERKRNILGKSFVYTKSDKKFAFSSYYGDFECKVSTNQIEL